VYAYLEAVKGEGGDFYWVTSAVVAVCVQGAIKECM